MEGVRGQHEHHNQQNNDKEGTKLGLQFCFYSYYNHTLLPGVFLINTHYGERHILGLSFKQVKKCTDGVVFHAIFCLQCKNLAPQLCFTCFLKSSKTDLKSRQTAAFLTCTVEILQ